VLGAEATISVRLFETNMKYDFEEKTKEFRATQGEESDLEKTR
jgi:hypothetical protein